MLRYTKYCAMGLFLVIMLFSVAATSSNAAEQDVVTYTESEWENVIYYVAALTGEWGQNESDGYQDVELKITAVDEYELYVNGDLYDSENDGDYQTVDVYDIDLNGAQEINIGVKVTNHGEGNGNGLEVSINAGEDVLGTWLKIRDSVDVNNSMAIIPVSWWTFDAEGFESLGYTDDNWYDFDEDTFDDTSITKYMKRAQLGSFTGDLDSAFPEEVVAIAGYLSDDADIGSDVGGGIRIRRIEGENIALGKPAQHPDFTDGDLADKQEVSSALGETRYVDLGRIYRVNKMTLTTGQDNANNFENYSIRGYAVETSLDQYYWVERGIIHDIGEPNEYGNVNEGGYDNYSVEFPGQWARYARFKLTELRQLTPYIGEILVYGEGYNNEAYYESPWIDFDDPLSYKNFSTVEWTGTVPDGTEITVQTMTKNGVDGEPSAWSAEQSAKTFAFGSPEPATHFKYRVNLSTQELDVSPVFKSFSVNYSKTDQPVTFANGFVSPNVCVMGENTEFMYTIAYTLAAGQDIQQVQIAVPGVSELISVYSSDAGVYIDATSTTTSDMLTLTFDTPITDTDTVAGVADTLRIAFDTNLMRSYHIFEAYLINSDQNDGAGGIMVWTNDEEGSSTVVVNKLIDGVLTKVSAAPKVFTPNNDGINDFTVIEFRLANVETDVKIKVFSTDGSLVATIYDEHCEPSDYRPEGNANAAKEMPGYWNGEDEDGDLVPPGIYVYQVIANTDDNDIIKGGTVVVAY